MDWMHTRLVYLKFYATVGDSINLKFNSYFSSTDIALIDGDANSLVVVAEIISTKASAFT